MDLDGVDPYFLPTQFFLSRGLGVHLFSQSSYLHAPGSQTLQDALNCISKFTGAFLFWFTSGSSSNLSRRIPGNQHGSKAESYKSSAQVKQITSGSNKLVGFHFDSISESEYTSPVIFSKVSSSDIKRLFREGRRLPSSSVLSLAAAVIPPFGNISSKVLAIPLADGEVQMHDCIDQSPCEVKPHQCGGLTFPDLNRRRHAVEPKTGIEFPVILDNTLDTENKSSLTSEVLVGTGSRTMKIIKIKSLKVYAFAFYVHPHSVCEKLGPKYASIPVGELNKHREFYEDLLREDIDMTVRLVINCNGMKVNAVKDAFEKSLRARLVKTNPDTDYYCLTKFRSCFTQDIPLPLGTTIDFRRTAEGQLITEKDEKYDWTKYFQFLCKLHKGHLHCKKYCAVGGHQIGAVHSRELCRAFFDMYIGDVPVSEQTKEEIGQNVASMIRRC